MPAAGAPAAELAPAKVNLALHVTGRRADGFHELDSLVAFAGMGDLVEAAPAERLGLRVAGPFAAGLDAGPGNLVLRAAAAVRPEGRGAALRLTKRLPVAAGLGGGSADAAAALRLLGRLWGVPMPGAPALVALGADVPVCVEGRAARMRGVGEALAPAPLPAFWLALANPGVAVSTAAVFAGLERRDNPGMEAVPRFAGAADLAAWLARQRNDLEAPALRLAPAIAAARAALAAQPGCLLARMSGSGATCFGIFAGAGAARAAAAAIARAEPGWWVAAAPAQESRATT
ncbi:4-(cytidine 5'-diphospho)-2-C-methyl-D-erythritol kinase [Amaricoccus sp.]|uniref:4-(cytidine 5'-diphospho)-2-C-methyl-D-erythritol kinase n=1 Tax=Amaricoccus sp. TaxID=1872485 RepID=UPI001B672B51|nr:4-(cytidine 5'-diphospho)-2-C-methyl-D-erythritol kinase [Amaricoccus sp.]MBP7001562.1 4-(cytidine 5'-diphospho)-2-C-methyl-D-erythritol kinase [Amaricoccus sp.]